MLRKKKQEQHIWVNSVYLTERLRWDILFPTISSDSLWKPSISAICDSIITASMWSDSWNTVAPRNSLFAPNSADFRCAAGILQWESFPCQTYVDFKSRPSVMLRFGYLSLSPFRDFRCICLAIHTMILSMVFASVQRGRFFPSFSCRSERLWAFIGLIHSRVWDDFIMIQLNWFTKHFNWNVNEKLNDHYYYYWF